MSRIYLDHAATTKCDDLVAQRIFDCLTKDYGNPGALYADGSLAKRIVREARDTIAGTLDAQSEEVFFTASGTEADNWAIRGLALANPTKRHIITSKIEHHAILHTMEYLEKSGYEITYLDVDQQGFVDLKLLKASIRSDTLMVSVMMINNEIGTIEPIGEIAKICHAHDVYVHTDAVQAYGQINIDVKEMDIDLLSASGHKFYGPKGVGFLYIRKGIAIDPLIYGGQQERGRRAGTENVPGIAGIGLAAKIAHEMLNDSKELECELRDILAHEITTRIPGASVNGPSDASLRAPGILNVYFPGKRAETALIMLDMNGICASAGSACTSGSLDPSHVLRAIGMPDDMAYNCLRFSIGRDNTRDDIDHVVEALCRIYKN